MYSAASAVLLNELLKGFVSFSIAFSKAVHSAPPTYASISNGDSYSNEKRGSRSGNGKEEWSNIWEIKRIMRGAAKMRREVFR